MIVDDFYSTVGPCYYFLLWLFPSVDSHMEDSKVMQIPRCIKIQVFFMIVFFMFSIMKFTALLFGYLSKEESFL